MRVEVRLGGQTWRTSVFPARAGSHVLPVKAAVRQDIGKAEGDTVHVVIAERL